MASLPVMQPVESTALRPKPLSGSALRVHERGGREPHDRPVEAFGMQGAHGMPLKCTNSTRGTPPSPTSRYVYSIPSASVTFPVGAREWFSAVGAVPSTGSTSHRSVPGSPVRGTGGTRSPWGCRPSAVSRHGRSPGRPSSRIRLRTDTGSESSVDDQSAACLPHEWVMDRSPDRRAVKNAEHLSRLPTPLEP
jgi:hypothetical protein